LSAKATSRQFSQHGLVQIIYIPRNGNVSVTFQYFTKTTCKMIFIYERMMS